MARLLTRVRVSTRGIGLMNAAMLKATARAVQDTCHDIAADAKASAHVITGAMRASVYIIVQGEGGRPVENNYIMSATQARGLNPRAYVEPSALPESGKIQGVVGVAVNYAQYEEIARGHKFLLPAADKNRSRFEQRMANITKGGA